MKGSSQISGFYKLSVKERLERLTSGLNLSDSAIDALKGKISLTEKLCDSFIENAIGSFELPLGIATNFLVNDEEVLVPMVVEESSVVAAASYGAKLARAKGGFRAESTEPVMTGQIQLFVGERSDFDLIINNEKSSIAEKINAEFESLVNRGGGFRDLRWRYIREIQSLILYLDVDTRDAMGANIINSVCEKLAHRFAKIFDCETGLKILTNLTTRRMAKASCVIPATILGTDQFSGESVVDRIEAAYLFAKYDIYRAATHNKGVMNGIDPLIIATGNDWRAVEAGAHSYAARNHQYEPMTVWRKNSEGDLEGTIELPMALGTVGGVTKLHPMAKAALEILGDPNARRLSEIAVSLGLAQNLSALRALATEGIQKGHMNLHKKNLEMMKEMKEGKN